MLQSEVKYKQDKLAVLARVSKTYANENRVNNGTLFTPFSNKVAWIKSLNTAHAFIADTQAKQFLIYNTFYKKDYPPTTLAFSKIWYDIGTQNGDTTYGIKYSLDVEETFVHIKSHFSKQSNIILQYSKAKNVDYLTTESKTFKMILEYKFN